MVASSNRTQVLRKSRPAHSKSFKMGKNFKVGSHKLVPKHVKLSDIETKKLLEEYKITTKDLPKILATDTAIAELNAKPGDVIKITRESKTAGEIVYCREVIDG